MFDNKKAIAQLALNSNIASTTKAGIYDPDQTAVVRAGDFIFISGQMATEKGCVSVDGIVAQTEHVLDNIIQVLRQVECGLEHVVKVNIWLDDPSDYNLFNTVFDRYFVRNPPARSTVRSAWLADTKIEMDVVAYKPL